MKFKNFIFDFGNVLYKITPHRTIAKFAELSGMNPDFFRSEEFIEKYINSFERGEFSEDEFRNIIRNDLNLDLADEGFNAAWNLTLDGIFIDSIDLVSSAKQLGKVFLLSNTNPIHARRFIPECRQLFDFFDEIYLSYELLSLKPDPLIFRKMLDLSCINPHESIFIDDQPANIKTANQIGLATILVDNRQILSDIFHTVIKS